MVEASTKPKNPRSSSLRTFVLTAAAVAAVGYELGSRDAFPYTLLKDTSTPLLRVGYVLRAQDPQASPEAWAGLRGDVDHVRASIEPDVRPVFDLVAALRGLESGGVTDWTRAGTLCRSLKWPRCDQLALETLKQRSRP